MKRLRSQKPSWSIGEHCMLTGFGVRYRSVRQSKWKFRFKRMEVPNRAIIGLLGLILAFSPTTAGQTAQKSDVIVATESGLLRGVIEDSTRAFRGIPYAAPPVGERRWRPPSAPIPWPGIRDASTFGNVCPQLDAIFSGNFIGSEDCLVLNIFTAANIEADEAQPVMVFFHGGGDVAGSSQNAPYGAPPPPLATHGVIVVTAEYRLGALGFFVHPLLAEEGNGSSGNYGLMDQIAALKWVQRNIRNFGGDPERVMAFGQSSGAADVQALLTSPAAKGLFSRAGIESDAIPLNEVRPLEAAEADQAPLVGLVGCGGVAEVLACLRAVPASVLVNNQFAVPLEFTIEQRVLPEDPFAVLQRDGTPVPLLLGPPARRRRVLVFLVISRSLSPLINTRPTFTLSSIFSIRFLVLMSLATSWPSIPSLRTMLPIGRLWQWKATSALTSA